ncbi:MAG: murein biosynthesis integral membrane protein MurJ [Acidimicrobiia bacterium]
MSTIRSSALVALGTAASRATGLLRLAALAYALGFTRLTDTYNLANTTPNIVYELILGGVLSATLVPVFVAGRERGDDRAASAVVSVAGVVLVALTVAGVLAAPAIVRLYTLSTGGAEAAAQRDVAAYLLRLFMPQMLFYGITAMATALLHAHRRFTVPAVTPVLNNLVVSATFFALPHLTGGRPTLAGARDDTGLLLLLGLGTTAGIAVMALAMLPSMRRAGIRLRPVFDWRHPAVRTVLSLSGWTAGYVAANQVALWVVLILANGTAGGVSAYQGAFIFFQLPHGLVAVSLMTTLAPDLASAASRTDLGVFRQRFFSGLRMMAVVMLPAAAGYVVLARPIVSFLLERGAFSAGDSDQTAACLALFAVGLVPFSLYLYALRGFYAFQDTRTPFFLNCFENGANIVLALVLEPLMGVRGLALAYSAAYGLAAVVSLRSLERRCRASEAPAVLRWRRMLVRMALAAGLVAGAVRMLLWILPESAPSVVKVLAGTVVGVLVYVPALRAMRVPEVGEVLSRLRSRTTPR